MSSAAPTQEFLDALRSIKASRRRDEVQLREIPAPTRIAPMSAAIEATIPCLDSDEPDLASGSFILLHDPAGNDAWQGTLRVVTMARAQLEVEMGEDPLLAEVAWSWLTDALSDYSDSLIRLAGTVTRTLSEAFGSLDENSDEVGLEVRSSWTPVSTDIGSHLLAWTNFLSQMAGLEPLPQGVTRLLHRS